MNKLNNLLIIAPHPDDEVLGCGGTIAKAREKGHEINVLYLSSGDNNEKTREKEAEKVCSFLEIDGFHFMRLKGGSFKVDHKNVQKIIKHFKKLEPDYIYINHEFDSDHEHKIAYRLVSESHWRYNLKARNKIKGIALYEIHKPLEKYNLVENITEYIDIKMQAMAFYKSQLETSRVDLAIKGLNEYRGKLHEQCDFAEVFGIKKWTNSWI